jgi:hypothetical protein
MFLRFILAVFVAAPATLHAGTPPGPGDWIPIRWWDASPKSLDLLEGTPVNCLVLPESVRKRDLIAAARRRKLVVLALATNAEEARRLSLAEVDGAVLEGEFAGALDAPGLEQAIRLPLRDHVQFRAKAPVIGTSQGLWPGLQIEHNGKVLAGPSSQPWVFTNTGFLQFSRASTGRPFWISVRPPAGSVFPPTRYVEAIADAAISGARWIITLDDDLARRLSAGEPAALAGWKTITAAVEYFENPQWRAYQPYATLALVQDTGSGGLLSGGLLDMMSSQHTAVLSVAASRLDPSALQGVKIVIDVDPGIAASAALAGFRHDGGMVVEPPPDGRFPVLAPGQITLTPQQVNHLQGLWELIYKTTLRKNFGSRVFNVNGTLTRVLANPGASSMLVHLVNYTEYEKTDPVTVHLLGEWKRARLYAPGEPVRDLQLYPVEGGMGVDIQRMNVIATVRVDR